MAMTAYIGDERILSPRTVIPAETCPAKGMAVINFRHLAIPDAEHGPC